MRKVIFHYHLFKNAGTSLDFALQQQFSKQNGEWVTAEFPAQEGKNRAMVREWVAKSESAKCFSSHTAYLPVPVIENVEVFPIIFIRHPIDRIASAYAFEKKQGAGTFGSVLARNTNLKGYIETRLSIPLDRQCRNFHTQRFATKYPAANISEFEKAQKAVTELPFVGMVEKFSESLALLSSKLGEFGFDGLSLEVSEKNVSQKKSLSLEEKIEGIETEIGSELFSKLVEANQEDLALHRIVSEIYE
ncbi:hypothetical protein FJ444_17885 [Aestuariibacter sp. GS-14]|uniref:sulfotransferase family 2 domain-containing protein n=1 Tax=Aestuariibacter sp. GS-14 TaxID=2590670 RepID=UPI0011279596|nr:sulfotransferase family 2 domain-containing protein [Aestuariibacter sp. GS-14]TPV55129.1 hypothetical protein FJ444_17885 [Aestuariibacter sp. GS-14]